MWLQGHPRSSCLRVLTVSLYQIVFWVFVPSSGSAGVELVRMGRGRDKELGSVSREAIRLCRNSSHFSLVGIWLCSLQTRYVHWVVIQGGHTEHFGPTAVSVK